MSLSSSLEDPSSPGQWRSRVSVPWRHVGALGVTVALGFAFAAWYRGIPAPAVFPAGFPVERHEPLAMSSPVAPSAARPRAVQHPIACEKLPNVPGKSITTVLVEFPPHALTPSHRHPGSVTAYVLKGTLRSQLNGGPVESFGVGGTWFEPPGTIHTLVENASATEPAELMAIFVADSDCGALTIFDQ